MAEQAQQGNANKGMNTKLYMIAVVVAILLILSAIFFFVAGRGKKDIPKVNQPNPNSRLVLPFSHAALA